MKHVTRIPVKPESVLIQAANLFDELRTRGTDAAIIVPDLCAAEAVKNALGLTDRHVFNAAAPRNGHWLLRHAFPAYVIANEAQCSAAVHKTFPGEGQFIQLLASRQRTFSDAMIYAFTESSAYHRFRRARVTTVAQKGPETFWVPPEPL